MSKCREEQEAAKGNEHKPLPWDGERTEAKGTEDVPIWQEGTDGRVSSLRHLQNTRVKYVQKYLMIF